MAINSPNGGNGSNGHIEKSPREIFSEGTLVQAAIRDSLRDVRILHKRMGVPLVGSVNGKVVEIPPEEIQIDLPGQ